MLNLDLNQNEIFNKQDITEEDLRPINALKCLIDSKADNIVGDPLEYILFLKNYVPDLQVYMSSYNFSKHLNGIEYSSDLIHDWVLKLAPSITNKVTIIDHGYTPESFTALLESFQHCKEISIYDSYFIEFDEEFKIDISQGAQKINTIEFSYCKNISDKTIKLILLSLSKTPILHTLMMLDMRVTNIDKENIQMYASELGFYLKVYD